MKKTVVRLSLLFLLAFVFLYFFFRKVEWSEVLNYLTTVDLKYFVILIVITPIHFITRAIRWEYLIKHEKKRVKFSNRFSGYAVGFTVSFIFPGRLGELIRPLYVARKERMSKGFLLGTIVVERSFDIMIMCLLLGLFILSKPLYPSYFRAGEEAYSNLQLWGIIGVAIALFVFAVALFLYFFREKALSMIAFFLKPVPHGVSHKILQVFEEFIQGLKFFHSVGNLLVFILLSFVVWLGIIFYYWIFFLAYGFSFPYFFIIPYVFLTMVGASIPTPGMAGGFHYFSMVGMTSFLGIDKSQAVGMTIVVHAIQLVVTCLIGYAILWKEGMSLFQLKKLGEAAEE
ncbi:MAG: flippase-like domain-containing protein [Candidatus Aminicenantes bacterium]|nr:flippase-like domain-containing protein [Candidatus Aminicenantes bacterium]